MNLLDPGITTPCLVVEQRILESNAERLRQRFAGSGIAHRPHLKTVKCLEAARYALPSATGPATVSTLREAEEFGRAGITDLMYAVGIAPQKFDRIRSLRESGIDLKIIVDNVAGAKAVAAYAREHHHPIPTLVEIDVDDHRSGVASGERDTLLAVARSLDHGDCLAGIMTHAGESYRLSDPVALRAAAERERLSMAKVAATLREAGLPCEMVSIGSTPTALSLMNTTEITEIRAGVYLFFDLCQAGIGVCDIDDIALSVLTTVIGHQRNKGWTICDAGWMALSADRSTASQAVDQHFGVVCDAYGRPLDDLVVVRASQEHGVIAARPGCSVEVPHLAVGTRLRILPNHACATAAQHGEYQVVDGGLEIRQTWARFGGW